MAMSISSPTSEMVVSATGSAIGNPYWFTGRRVDVLDNGAKLLQINRHRYYDYETGRWLSADPLGVTPGDYMNGFNPLAQYADGRNLWEYVRSNPINGVDYYGSYYQWPQGNPYGNQTQQKQCKLIMYFRRPDQGADKDHCSVAHAACYLAKKWGNTMACEFDTFDNDYGRLSYRLQQFGCCCYQYVIISDHGGSGRRGPNGEIFSSQCFGGPEKWGREMGVGDISKLCPLLCQKTRIKLTGCNVGQGHRNGFQWIFNACPKIAKILACTYTNALKGKGDNEDGCEGQWITYYR